MDATILQNQSVVRMTPFEKKCDSFSKQCAVLLTFVIPLSTTATNLVLLCLIPSWFLAGNLSSKAKIASANPVAQKAILLFGVFLAGALYSEAPLGDVVDTLGKMTKLLYLPFLLPLMVEEKWRQRAITVFLAAMALTWVLCILKSHFGLRIGTRFSYTVFKDSIYTNFMMAVACFITAHYCLDTKDLIIRCLLWTALVGLILYVLFISTGRSGYAVFAALWILLCTQRFSLTGWIIGVCLLTLLIGVSYKRSTSLNKTVTLAVQNIEQYKSGDTQTSVGSRLEYLRETLKLAKKRPWFGYGTGSFKSSYAQHALTHHLFISQNPHNEYANIFFQLGLMGVVAFLALLGSIFKNSYHLPKREQYFSQGVVLAMVLGCTANSWLMDFTSGYLFIVLIAICFGSFPIKKEHAT